ncbi:Cadherin-7 [Merluccius polli]|uniref:Cadherin-7 n=1 Tax=Merluccius polli TaxID=89951 RepID=A0AA47M373_MERPO|nr:Cadherin-7 [Merluccius polli]
MFLTFYLRRPTETTAQNVTQQTDRQADRQADRQTDRQADRQLPLVNEVIVDERRRAAQHSVRASRRREEETRRPGDQETRRPGDPETRSPGVQETRRPGDQETRRPGDQESRSPGDQETRRPGADQMSWWVVLSGFGIGSVLLSLWAPCCGELTLNSVPLAPGPWGPARGGPPQPGGSGQGGPARSRRSWVWNQFFVLEEYTGDEPLYVGKLHSDVDRGDGQVTYVLSGEGAPSIFTIDANTGDIHATKRLDREAQAYYTLRAQARDRATDRPVEPESQFVVKVQDINDNEPRFPDGPYAASVPEMSPMGTSVVTVVATDADDPTYGNSARVVYSILQGQPYFSVEPKTGVVRTALADMDRESRDQYLLVIQAKDMVGQMGGLSGTTSVTVTLSDVNDNPPHFYRKSYQFLVPESVPVSAVVAKVKAVDSDLGPNADVDYSILEGDPLGVFRIATERDTQEGLLTLQKVLDFEARSSYTLTVEVTNRHVDPRFAALGPFSDRATVRLLVKNVDEPPVFSAGLATMAVSEAVAVGTSVGRVSALDPDATDSPVRYSIDRNTDLERYFHIDGTSGVLRTARPLDRELVSLHNITVMASESLDPRQVGRAVVLISITDVNDNAPVFAMEYQTFVCENARPGQRDRGRRYPATRPSL